MIPKDGLKLIVIAGYFNDKPIWRQVGKLMLTKQGKPMVLLDRTFAPSGVKTDDPNSAFALINCVEYSKEDLNKKDSYSKPKRDNTLRAEGARTHHNNYYDDDIPF